MTSLTFYGGVGEIGGNKILLEDQDTRVFLDFGMSFKQSEKFFSEFMQPRKCNCLKDFYATGLLPVLEGVYRLDYLEYHGCEHEPRMVDGVLISHAHADHAQYIHHLRCDIPLYMSPESYAILKTLEETGSGGFSDLTRLKKDFCLRPKKRGEGLTRLIGDDAKEDRVINLVRDGEAFRVGEVEVRAFSVDHSLPGAFAYLVHASEASILYTGDFRFHGYRGEQTVRMVEEAGEEKVDILVTEGTNINEASRSSEEDVRRKAKRVVDGTRGLTIVNFPQRDLDRLITFRNIARDTGRQLVLGFKHAYMLEQFQELRDYPRLDDPYICFFADRKGWGLVGRDDYPVGIIKQDYSKWERRYLDLPNTLNYRDVKADQKNYLLYCSFYQLNELIDVEPASGSTFIRSICEPFNEEMEIDEERVRNWLKLYGLGPPWQIHASGHASGSEIRGMIHTLDPKKIIPVHTESPEAFKEAYGNTCIVRQGEKISF